LSATAQGISTPRSPSVCILHPEPEAVGKVAISVHLASRTGSSGDGLLVYACKHVSGFCPQQCLEVQLESSSLLHYTHDLSFKMAELCIFQAFKEIIMVYQSLDSRYITLSLTLSFLSPYPNPGSLYTYWRCWHR
jgi:hypothetical protein